MFLAMTAEEIQNTSPLPDKIAFLGCHFSSEAPHPLELPQGLSKSCGIILDDREPIPHVTPEEIGDALSSLAPAFILLDFQRPPTENSRNLCGIISKLRIPTAMPPDYALKLNCPVFLPPVPPHIPIEEYLHPWRAREIWLELALDAVQITVTAQGSRSTYFPHADPQSKALTDSMLHCHYLITQKPDAFEFYCYRTREDIVELRNALPPNVTHTIGLFQELLDI